MANPEQKRGTQSVPYLPWIAGLLLIVIAVLLIRHFTRNPVEVRVATATYQDLSNTVSTNGNVEPIMEFPVHAPTAGVIKHIYVDVNQHVGIGTPLLAMDTSDAVARVAAARDTLDAALLSQQDIRNGGTTEDRQHFGQDLTAARLEQRNANADLQTRLSLQVRGAASASEVAVARQRMQAADNAVANAQARSTVRYGSADVTSAGARVSNAQAGLKAAQDALAALRVDSPIAGTVYSVSKYQYDFVRPEDDLMDIADLNKLQVRAYFDEPDVGKLARGEPVKLTWDAKPNLVWHGHVERPPTQIASYNTRTVGECLITVDDAHGDLLPNTTVLATVTTSQQDHVLSIPRAALYSGPDGENPYVYRIVDGRLNRTPVTVGTVVNLISAEVVSGLKAGESIVLRPVAGGQELTEGMAVKQVR